MKEYMERMKARNKKADLIADDIEAKLFKKYTQESPEWNGGANC